MRHLRPNEIEPDAPQAAIKRLWKNREPGELLLEHNWTCQECGTCYANCPGVYACPWCTEDY
jgi:heterodisulfide reductase subunit C